MLPVARTGDVTFGICTGHSPYPLTVTGTIVSLQTTTIVGGLPAARTGDLVIGSCGHTGIIVIGSLTVMTNGQATARLGDQFSGVYSGVILTGCNNVLCK